MRVRSARPRLTRSALPRCAVDLQVADADVGVDQRARGRPARRARRCVDRRSRRPSLDALGQRRPRRAPMSRVGDDARAAGTRTRASPMPSCTLTSVLRRRAARGRAGRGRSAPTPSRYSGRSVGDRRRPVLALADAAAQVDVGGGDDGERQHEHDDGEDEPSRPAEQPGGDQPQPGEDRDRGHRRRRRRARRGSRRRSRRRTRPRARSATSVARAITRAGSSPSRAAEGAVERQRRATVTAATPSRPGPKKNAGGASVVSPAMQASDRRQHDRGRPRAVLDPRRLAVVARQERGEREVGQRCRSPLTSEARDERDPEEHRVDAEVAAEAAGDARDVLVGRRAGQLRAGRAASPGPGSGSLGAIWGSSGMTATLPTGRDPTIGDHPR